MGTVANPHRTQEVVRFLYEEVLSQSQPEDSGHCTLSTGTSINASGYGRIIRRLNGYKHELLIHHVIWMANQIPTAVVVPGKLSHLCHKKLCLNPYHIVPELIALPSTPSAPGMLNSMSVA